MIRPLTPLEIAGGVPLGREEDAAGLPDVPAGLEPLAAFEDAIRPALARPPCLISFSGGRDSSAILAVAVRLAHQEGFEPPIPVTLRFRGAPGTRETDWQERVAAHVGVDEWIRIELGDELDYVGPIALRLLARHGVLHPPSALLFWIQLEQAQGGSLLTGFGGDTVVGGWLPAHASEVRGGRTRFAPRDLPTLAWLCAPQVARRAVMRRRLTRPVWLTRAAHGEFVGARVRELASRPSRWDRFLAWEVRLRRTVVMEVALEELAGAADALIAHPLHDRRFIAALAQAGGARGFGDRTSTMRALFGGDLPEDALARSTKANFVLTYFRGATRAFARRWDGLGFDPDLVNAEILRGVWLERIVDQRAGLAIQWAWLDSARRGLEELPADGVQLSEVGGTADAKGG